MGFTPILTEFRLLYIFVLQFYGHVNCYIEKNNNNNNKIKIKKVLTHVTAVFGLCPYEKKGFFIP